LVEEEELGTAGRAVMARMPPVSVIIPCFNARSWIREALRSVIEQDVPDIETIVVDDGSTDDGVDIVEREFRFARVIRSDNAGPSHARNIGTRASSGELVQYLDADDVLATGKLAVQIEALQRSGADVAYGDWQELIRQPDGSFGHGRVFRREIVGSPEIALFGRFWCPTATYLFRRSIIERVGGWNEGLLMFEDARFILDCALRGGRFVYSPGVMAQYRFHASGSLSKRDPGRFVRDCFKNASEVEEWWGREDGIGEERRNALLATYAFVARASFEKDRRTFDRACEALERLAPGYVPRFSVRLAVASRIVGYRRAEMVALWWRRVKRFFSGAVGPAGADAKRTIEV
jgi:glycosyltransferase involved in cell wall biosynthesis